MTDSTNTVMPVAPMCGTSGNGNGGMWGGDWSAWIVLFLIFGMFGFGGNGWGWGGGGGAAGQSVRDGYVLSSDFANIERKMDLIQGDQCAGFAAVNQGLATGFAGVQTSFANAEIARANMQATMTDQLYNLGISQQTQFNNGQIAMMQGFNGVQQGIAQGNYNLAQQGCETRNTINATARDIIDSQTCGTRAILDALNAQSIEQKNERIAELTNQNNALRLAASQQAQNAYLVDQLRPCPIPAYNVPNPYCCTPVQNNCCCSGNYA